LTFLEKRRDKKAGVEKKESSLEDADNDTSLVTDISYDKIKNFKLDLSDSLSVNNVKHYEDERDNVREKESEVEP
jgi:hypothetical protein